MIDSSVRYKRTFGVESAPDTALDSEGAGATKTNPTFFPDALMLTIQPIFLIRHPFKAFPSCLRVWKGPLTGSIDEKANEEVLTFCWTRLLYEWYTERAVTDATAPTAILIDADDFIRDWGLQEAVCNKLGFDVDRIQRTWDAATEDEVEKLGPIAQVCSSLYHSNGVLQSTDHVTIDLDEARKAWSQEFGADEASKLASFAEEAMPDYIWLKERCLRVAP